MERFDLAVFTGCLSNTCGAQRGWSIALFEGRYAKVKLDPTTLVFVDLMVNIID
jgi:hypothetical protein